MSRKRRNTSSPESDESTPSKRYCFAEYQDLKHNDAVMDGDEKPTVDALSGQLGAFPGLGNNDELYYGPASNGLEYLRMVRSEAKGIPSLLVRETREENGRIEMYGASKPDEVGGYYSDGAYTVLDNTQMEHPVGFTPYQLRYYDSLLTQFRLVQATMRCIPPATEIQKLSSSRITSFPAQSKTAREYWYDFIQQNDPHTIQVVCMDQESTMSLLDLIRRRLMVLLRAKNNGIVRRLGSWIWAMLGNCRHCGELGSQEIGGLRALAQKAVTMNQQQGIFQRTKSEVQIVQNGSLREVDADTRSEVEDIDIEQRGDTGDLSENDVEANSYTQTGIIMNDIDDESSVADQIGIILDMIITVVGEVYRQRDLLDFREPWTTSKAQQNAP